MKIITKKAFGKVNLGLDVTGKREDGYHEVKMVMQTVGVYDEVRVKLLDDPVEGDKAYNIKINVKNSPESERHYYQGQMDKPVAVPLDENNLAWKAAALVMDEFGLGGNIEINIEKNIPVAGGMAGGSADAAATIEALNDIFELKMDQDKKDELGLKLGADVPFCFRRGTYLAEGIGEKLTKLRDVPRSYIVIIAPEYEVSTHVVYSLLDDTEQPDHQDIDALVAEIEGGDIEKIAGKIGNILEPVTANMYPVIYSIKEELINAGAKAAIMTGSGPTVFGVFDDIDKAEDACKEFEKHPQIGRAIYSVFVWG